MTILSVTLESWSDRWTIAGISVLTVFAILVILVFVLQLFGVLFKHEANAVSQSASSAEAPSEAEEEAAVAMAVYLYQNDTHDMESGVLTIKDAPTRWGAELNERL